MSDDTIVACATPSGQGGVGIIRISGPSALSIAQKICQRQVFEPRFAHFVHVYDSNKEKLDSGVALYFPNPKSFTGEDVIELQLHGSPVLIDAIIQLVVSYGGRLAQPGEFSLRAFLNDKIDLIQAEAIADLISAQSLSSAKMAGQSLEGVFSRKIENLNSRIIQLRMYVEAAIDFPEEEIDFLQDGHVMSHLEDIISALEAIIKNTNQGVLIQEGVTIVIAGKPNVGKSTLINALAQKDIAIVTDIAGTTRDIMKTHILIDDIPVHIVDTAGLRESNDPVEKIGIQKAWDNLEKADCLLYLVDVQNKADSLSLDQKIKQRLPTNTPVIRVVNKIDLVKETPRIGDESVFISAKETQGLDVLKKLIKKAIGQVESEGGFMARRRHLTALQSCYHLLLAGKMQLSEHRAGELLAEDLNHAHMALCEITGQYRADDLLGEIFSSFCIGK